MGKIKILGIPFIDEKKYNPITELEKGAFMVVPSGPGLASIDQNSDYWEAIRNCDFALPDSGYMILLYRLFYFKGIKKYSGFRFIRKFFNQDSVRKETALFLIDPSKEESDMNREYLNSIGVNLIEDYQYIAPRYKASSIVDYELLNKLETLERKPKYILINLGGSVQEILGFFIRKKLSYRPSIICTGAAIAFLTGKQAKIPKLIDYFYMGWLFRTIQNPKIFLFRYLRAIRLFKVFLLYRSGKI